MILYFAPNVLNLRRECENKMPNTRKRTVRQGPPYQLHPKQARQSNYEAPSATSAEIVAEQDNLLVWLTQATLDRNTLERLLNVPDLNVEPVWSRCLVKAIEIGRGDIIEMLMQWREKIDPKNQPVLGAYDLPMIAPAYPQGFLDAISKFGICIKHLYMDSPRLPSWYHTAIMLQEFKEMPIGYNSLGQRFISSQDFSIASLLELCKYPSPILVNLFQGLVQMSPKWGRIALSLVHIRQKGADNVELPFFNSSDEQRIRNNDLAFIESQIKTYKVDKLLQWINLVISTPETFMHQCCYQDILYRINNYCSTLVPEQTPTTPTVSALKQCAFFYPLSSSRCIEDARMRLRKGYDPLWCSSEDRSADQLDKELERFINMSS